MEYKPPTAGRDPAVTIVMPVHNGAAWVEHAIESVKAQTFEDWELLVFDNASTDASAEITGRCAAGDPRIRLIRSAVKENMAQSRNRGFSLARGTLIAAIDCDDIWLDPKKLEVQVKALEDASHGPRPLGVLGTWMIRIDERGAKLPGGAGLVKFATTDANICRSILYRNHVAHSSALFLKQAALDCGGYDEGCPLMSDHDLWLKIGINYALATLPTYSIAYRVHKQSATQAHLVRVAIEELAVIFRHRRNYPGFAIGVIKGLLRLGRAFWGSWL